MHNSQPEDENGRSEVQAALGATMVKLLSVLSEYRCQLEAADRDGRSLSLAEAIPGELHGLDAQSLRHLLRHIDQVCGQSLTTKQPIAFLGPIYSFSYLAAAKFFGVGAELVPVASIAAAFDEISRQHAKYAVVPIENNTDGRVVDTLGMFAKMPLQICGEVRLPIQHCLLGICTRAEVREVHSKPQALSQCRGWLADHLPDATLVEVSSTALAASIAASKPGVAAIASMEAGLHHGCRVIDESIADNPDNVTRFAIIRSRDSEDLQPVAVDASVGQKTSLMFQLDHSPGALAAAMVLFSEAQINLTWIESFPLPACPNEYLFFVELEGDSQTPSIAAALRSLAELAIRFEVLGSYPAAS